MSDAQTNAQATEQATDQLNAQLDAQPAEMETKFAVGWQKLTKQEFLDAVAIALLDKVQDLPSFQSADASSFQILPKSKSLNRSSPR